MTNILKTLWRSFNYDNEPFDIEHKIKEQTYWQASLKLSKIAVAASLVATIFTFFTLYFTRIQAYTAISANIDGSRPVLWLDEGANDNAGAAQFQGKNVLWQNVHIRNYGKGPALNISVNWCITIELMPNTFRKSCGADIHNSVLPQSVGFSVRPNAYDQNVSQSNLSFMDATDGAIISRLDVRYEDSYHNPYHSIFCISRNSNNGISECDDGSLGKER